MIKTQQRLILEQFDQKIRNLRGIDALIAPSKGWIHTIRSMLKMSLRQLGNKLGISAQSVKEIEQREANGSITLRNLNEVANALEMKVVYIIIPKDDSIYKMIEKRATEIASEIVLRTSNSMKLEDQENSQSRIKKAIKEKTDEIINNMPKYLWD